ncbi:unnamed protein product [Heligmosomoides polygyrus]|uniref:Uncharacterized protein n=1 Tax=Heligmosomoides polygyrus TaxID=6339 RepID=A0A183GJF7_HELPZ|nr:unnamed protein product [Heligmosomoides polygyrus]
MGRRALDGAPLEDVSEDRRRTGALHKCAGPSDSTRTLTAPKSVFPILVFPDCGRIPTAPDSSLLDCVQILADPAFLPPNKVSFVHAQILAPPA